MTNTLGVAVTSRWHRDGPTVGRAAGPAASLGRVEIRLDLNLALQGRARRSARARAFQCLGVDPRTPSVTVTDRRIRLVQVTVVQYLSLVALGLSYPARAEWQCQCAAESLAGVVAAKPGYVRVGKTEP